MSVVLFILIATSLAVITGARIPGAAGHDHSQNHDDITVIVMAERGHLFPFDVPKIGPALDLGREYLELFFSNSSVPVNVVVKFLDAVPFDCTGDTNIMVEIAELYYKYNVAAFIGPGKSLSLFLGFDSKIVF